MTGSQSRVTLKHVADALQGHPIEASVFLDLQTGECRWFYDAVLAAAQSGDEPGREVYWVPDDIRDAAEVLQNRERFRPLPCAEEIDEMGLMRQFAGSIGDPALAEHLLHLLHRPGAYRNFKDAVARYHVDRGWFAFRDRALFCIARDWLTREAITFDDDAA